MRCWFCGDNMSEMVWLLVIEDEDDDDDDDNERDCNWC